LGEFRQSQCARLPSLASKASANLRAGTAPVQIQNNMAHELAPKLNPRRGARPRCSTTARVKLGAGKQLQPLVKCWILGITAALALLWFSLQTQPLAEFYRRRSKPNLDKSDIEG